MIITRLKTAFLAAVICINLGSLPGYTAPYAAMVMDARTGEVLHARNANTRLHPASLTKMMTLYIAFEAVRLGEITLDTLVSISANAASEPPSRLGLRAGQRIRLRYLIRASAVKSANDAATAIAEAIGGSEAAFIQRMNRTARALGMRNTTFKNAHGLTAEGHLSTARDMTIMGRHMLYDYPQYYNLFSRRSTSAGTKTVRNTNTRLLDAYPGADGIKTGYTRAAGFNLVASAERGSERIIATVFGGRSTTTRNARIVELLDMGFARAPTRVAFRPPGLPTYQTVGVGRGVTVVSRSARPVRRPNLDVQQLAEVESPPQTEPNTEVLTTRGSSVSALNTAVSTSIIPISRDEHDEEARVPTPVSRDWAETYEYAIELELQQSRLAAERLLLRTALQEFDALDNALRHISQTSQGFQPVFVGLSRTDAMRACTRLVARQVQCDVVGS